MPCARVLSLHTLCFINTEIESLRAGGVLGSLEVPRMRILGFFGNPLGLPPLFPYVFVCGNHHSMAWGSGQHHGWVAPVCSRQRPRRRWGPCRDLSLALWPQGISCPLIKLLRLQSLVGWTSLGIDNAALIFTLVPLSLPQGAVVVSLFTCARPRPLSL